MARTQAQARAERREMDRMRERAYREERRAKNRALHAQERAAKSGKREDQARARLRCAELAAASRAVAVAERSRTLSAVEHARALSNEARTARKAAKAQRQSGKATTRHARREAREGCATGKAWARSVGSENVARARAARLEERKSQRELDRILRTSKALEADRRKRTTRAERLGESDDEVRASIDPGLVPLFNRVRRGIKGSPRMSRTEAFLHYVDEHPGERAAAEQRAADAWLRKQIREQAREHAQSSGRARRVPRASHVPF
jgi:hypothetical protein